MHLSRTSVSRKPRAPPPLPEPNALDKAGCDVLPLKRLEGRRRYRPAELTGSSRRAQSGDVILGESAVAFLSRLERTVDGVGETSPSQDVANSRHRLHPRESEHGRAIKRGRPILAERDLKLPEKLRVKLDALVPII